MARQSIELKLNDQTVVNFGRKRIRGGITAVDFQFADQVLSVSFRLQRVFFGHGKRERGVLFSVGPADSIREWAKPYVHPLHSFYLHGRCYIVQGTETLD